MFLIFTLRRGDIISPGDLGLQKGLLRWFVDENPAIHSAKLVSLKPIPLTPDTPSGITSQADVMVPACTPRNTNADLQGALLTPVTPSRAEPMEIAAELASLGTPFFSMPPFPESETLTREKLRGRLTKKVKGNMYITPQEMEELTVSWKPYRSVGLYYMWSLE